MANNYNDDFSVDPYKIGVGKPLSADGMNKALNTKEKVANKATVINDNATDAQYPSAKAVKTVLDTKENVANKKDTVSNSSTEYPSSKAVFAAIQTTKNDFDAALAANDKDTVHKSKIETITGIKTFGTAEAAAEPLLGTVKTVDAADNGAKFASEAQVYKKQDKLTEAQLGLLNSLSTLSFFPRGTILPFSNTAWDEASAEFRTIWKICDGNNGTINLVGKFICGGAYANYGETGGTDSAQVPYHTHGLYDPGHVHGVNDPGHTHEWVRSNAGGTQLAWGLWPDYGNCYLMSGVSNVSIQSSGTSISINYAGGEADNRPAYCSVIFIEKVV